jgi:uncharacterized protein YgfB (UPF0149 family)
MEDTLFQIISAVLGLVAVFLGGFWLKAKGKLTQLKDIMTEGGELLTAISDAIVDNKIDKAEGALIQKEYNEFITAIKKLFS